jgi:hypothetical protein
MEDLAGAERGYVKESLLSSVHDSLYVTALTQFDDMATMGAASLILKMRQQVCHILYVF